MNVYVIICGLIMKTLVFRNDECFIYSVHRTATPRS